MEKCPYCKSKRVTNHSRRKIKEKRIQIFRCKICKRYFSNKKFKYKTYNKTIKSNALSCYKSGNTLLQTAKEIRKKFNKDIPITTLRSWIKKE